MEFNIFLANPFKLKYDWQALCEEVAALFKPSIKQNKKFSKVRVRSTMSKPSLQPGDVIVYVIPNQDWSIVARHFKEWDEEPELGYTHAKEPCACEVYLDTEYADVRHEPAFLAKVIWHEIGHNKAKQGNKAFHKNDGLRKKQIKRYDSLSDANAAFMAEKLGKHVPQWVGGFDL